MTNVLDDKKDVDDIEPIVTNVLDDKDVDDIEPIVTNNVLDDKKDVFCTLRRWMGVSVAAETMPCLVCKYNVHRGRVQLERTRLLHVD